MNLPFIIYRTPLRKNARFSVPQSEKANNNHANNTNNLNSKDAEAAEASTPLNPDQKPNNNPSLADRIKDKISVSIFIHIMQLSKMKK